MKELTPKQKAFIEELPKNQWNGTKAALIAGYSEKSAGVMACRLLKNPRVSEELEKRTAEIAEKTEVEVSEIIVALRKIAFGEKATNSERIRALELLGKHVGCFQEKEHNREVPRVIVIGLPTEQAEGDRKLVESVEK